MWRKAGRLALLLAGIGLGIILLLPHLGEVGPTLRRVGWGFLGGLLSSALVYLLDAWAWRQAFLVNQPAVSFWKLFNVRMAGEALNRITPLASMGGEPLKGYLLSQNGSTLSDAVASVAITKNIMTQAQIGFIFLGVALALGLLPGRVDLLGFALFPGLILAAMLVTAVLDLRLRRLRKEGKEPLAGVGGGRAARMRKAAAEFWEVVADFIWTNPRGYLRSLIAFFLGWLAGAIELFVYAGALGLPLSLIEAIVLEALVCSVTMATFFIPANAGSQEGGMAFVGQLFRLGSPDALAFAVLRRGREAFWVLYGLSYLGLTQGRVLLQPPDPEQSPA
ncbi:MAG: flippase-like domain-containing protein [Armatimonadetes bacterium]|nr:flippase-like domain-containing protein [Armatimonadota bacterium]